MFILLLLLTYLIGGGSGNASINGTNKVTRDN